MAPERSAKKTMTPDEMKEHETARGEKIAKEGIQRRHFPNAGSVRNKPRLAKSS
jgi:hypothetical protein